MVSTPRAARRGQGRQCGAYRRCDEATRVLPYERNGVDRTEVVVVRELLLALADVVLDDLLARACRQETVVVSGPELGLVRHLATGERVDALAGLRVPELHVTVPAAAEELRAVVVEVYMANRRAVTKVCALDVAAVVHVPQLDLRVRAARKQQVAILREKLDRLGESKHTNGNGGEQG